MSLSSNIRAGAAYVEVTAETSKLQRNLKTAQADLQSFGRSCSSIGKDLLMVSGAMALPLGLAVKSFAAFDDQMRLVRAVTQATQSEFESLTAVAAKLGRETSFTAQQVADGMTALGRMGFSPKEIEAAIQPTLDLARASGTDLGEAADVAANSMRIFGIEAEKMSSVADILYSFRLKTLNLLVAFWRLSHRFFWTMLASPCKKQREIHSKINFAYFKVFALNEYNGDRQRFGGDFDRFV